MEAEEAIEIQAKQSLFSLISEHRKSGCTGENCPISFLMIYIWLKQVGVKFTKKEVENFIL